MGGPGRAPFAHGELALAPAAPECSSVRAGEACGPAFRASGLVLPRHDPKVDASSEQKILGDVQMLVRPLVAVVLFAGCIGDQAGIEDSQAGGPVQWRVVAEGSGTDFPAAGALVARDAQTLERMWRLHSSDAPVPQIDFADEVVVALFAGQAPDSCHDIGVADVVKHEPSDVEVVVVKVDRVISGPESGCLRKVTEPYQFAALSRHDLVLFEFRVAAEVVEPR